MNDVDEADLRREDAHPGLDVVHVITAGVPLRRQPSEFTQSEIEAFAALEMETPSENLLHRAMYSSGEVNSLTSSASDALHGVYSQDGDASGSRNHALEVKLGDILTTAAHRPFSSHHRRVCSRYGKGGVVPLTPLSVTASGLQTDHRVDAASSNPLSVGADVSLLSILPKKDLVGGAEGVAEAVLRTRWVDLAGHGLHDTSTVECFLNATHIHLQHNQIASLEGMGLLAHLKVLVIHHNMIESLRPISDMDELMYVDASYNVIERLEPSRDLPCDSLRYLNLLGNPCSPSQTTPAPDGVVTPLDSSNHAVCTYRDGILAACPNLEVLDEVHCHQHHNNSEPRSRHCDSAINEGDSSRASFGDESATFSSSPRDSALISADLLMEDSTRPTSKPIASSTGRSPVITCADAQYASEQRITESRVSSRINAVREERSRNINTAKHPVGNEEHTTLRKSCESERWLLIYQQRAAARMKNLEAHLHQPYRASGDLIENPLASGCVPPLANDDEYKRKGRLEQLELQEDRQMQSRLYADLAYATEVAHGRLERTVMEQWANVDRIVQTRHALIEARRRRLHDEGQRPSAAYTASLEALQKESKRKDLSKYRESANN